MTNSTVARLLSIGVACAVVTTTALIAQSQAPATAPAPARVRVLFIGNSLTASNDLPAMVQAMARAGNVELQYEACAPGGASLEDHWNDGHCRKLMDEQQWDFVVLQQGPSSRDDSRANLKEWSAVGPTRSAPAARGLRCSWSGRSGGSGTGSGA